MPVITQPIGYFVEFRSLVLNPGSDIRALADRDQRTVCIDVKNNDGHLIFATQHHGRQIHNAQLLLQHLIEGYARKPRG